MYIYFIILTEILKSTTKTNYYMTYDPGFWERRRIMDESRGVIQKRIPKGTVLDIGCGENPIQGDYTICVDYYNVIDLFNMGAYFKNENNEFHEFDVMLPEFFEQEFLKRRRIDYVTLNAVVANLMNHETYDVEVINNLDQVINFLKELKQIAVEQVIIGEGNNTKELLVEKLGCKVIDEIIVKENFITDYQVAYLMTF